MFWFAAICFALVYVTNMVLALMQSKNYTTAYTTLKRRGRVAIGKRKGLLTTGAIVMFLLDGDGTIVEGTRLTGVTVLARAEQATSTVMACSGVKPWLRSSASSCPPE